MISSVNAFMVGMAAAAQFLVITVALSDVLRRVNDLTTLPMIRSFSLDNFVILHNKKLLKYITNFVLLQHIFTVAEKREKIPLFYLFYSDEDPLLPTTGTWEIGSRVRNKILNICFFSPFFRKIKSYKLQCVPKYAYHILTL